MSGNRLEDVAELATSLEKDDLISICPDENTTYHVQRTLLLKASSWFEGALNERFQEGQEKKLRFPGTSKATVELFLFWLFRGEIAVENPYNSDDVDCDHVAEAHARSVARAAIHACVRLWIFADQHIVRKLQDDTTRELYALLEHTFPSVDTVLEAYQNTPTGSALRRMMFKEVLQSLTHLDRDTTMALDDFEKLADAPGFLTEFAKAYRKSGADCPQALNLASLLHDPKPDDDGYEEALKVRDGAQGEDVT